MSAVPPPRRARRRRAQHTRRAPGPCVRASTEADDAQTSGGSSW
ncbi:hypothetical protein [Ornithinimicrobium kibberense]